MAVANVAAVAGQVYRIDYVYYIDGTTSATDEDNIEIWGLNQGSPQQLVYPVTTPITVMRYSCLVTPQVSTGLVFSITSGLAGTVGSVYHGQISVTPVTGVPGGTIGEDE